MLLLLLTKYYVVCFVHYVPVHNGLIEKTCNLPWKTLQTIIYPGSFVLTAHQAVFCVCLLNKQLFVVSDEDNLWS